MAPSAQRARSRSCISLKKSGGGPQWVSARWIWMGIQKRQGRQAKLSSVGEPCDCGPPMAKQAKENDRWWSPWSEPGNPSHRKECKPWNGSWMTSVSTQEEEQAWERVQWYRMRWIVEDYHQCLKTGCLIEERQLQTYEGHRRFLGFLAPLALRLLHLRAQARQEPLRPAQEVFTRQIVQVVALLAKVPGRPADHARVLACHCPPWWISGAQGGRRTRMENPLERMVTHPNSP